MFAPVVRDGANSLSKLGSSIELRHIEFREIADEHPLVREIMRNRGQEYEPPMERLSRAVIRRVLGREHFEVVRGDSGYLCISHLRLFRRLRIVEVPFEPVFVHIHPRLRTAAIREMIETDLYIARGYFLTIKE